MIEVVVSDFGGVLSSPLAEAFVSFQDHSGITTEQLGGALGRLSMSRGSNPLFEMECGRLAEPEFLAILGDQLTQDLGHPVAMHEFSDRYWAALQTNHDMVDWLHSAKARGLRLALLTNNVREWEPRWRAMLPPIDELFEVIVDSAFVGVRKPDPRIYEITTERLECEPGACVLIDDMVANCEAAQSLGWSAVRFADTAQTIAELEELLG
jgi:putative hydrolase of the HAD superfamily